MAYVLKCPRCGFDLNDAGTSKCPMCGSSITTAADGNVWIHALIQIAFCTAFMLAFGFPKFLIVIFGTLILIITAWSVRIHPKPVPRMPVPQKPASHPILLRVIVHATLIIGLVFVAFLLFGFVIFMNAWNRWQQYEGQPYHESEFQVVRAYWQPHRKGGPDVFASGNVESRQEWMSLVPYLHLVPRSQAELDSLVPPRTRIPVYLFPSLTGRARVQVLGDSPPAQASRRQAINTIKYSLLGLVVTAGIIFLLSRARRLCFAEPGAVIPELGVSAGGG